MKSYVMLYPGDPPMQVIEMSREQFLYYCPRHPVTISHPGSDIPTQVFPMRQDEIICDMCNADPGDLVTVLATQKGHIMRAYCEPCAKESWMPHCKENA